MSTTTTLSSRSPTPASLSFSPTTGPHVDPGMYVVIVSLLIVAIFCICGCIRFKRTLRQSNGEEVVDQLDEPEPKPRLWEPLLIKNTGKGLWRDTMPSSLQILAPPKLRHLGGEMDGEGAWVEGEEKVQVVVVIAMPQKQSLQAMSLPEYHFGICQTGTSGVVREK